MPRAQRGGAPHPSSDDHSPPAGVGPGRQGALVVSDVTRGPQVSSSSREAYRQFSLGLSLVASGGYEVFNTTAKRLGHAPVAVEPGDSLDLEAEVDCNLGGGTYTLQVQCHDYATPPSEICRFEAIDLQVPELPDFGGVAHLNPRLRVHKSPARVAAP